MNKLESNHDLSFHNELSFLSQFSTGIEYCEYEQQIDLSISFLGEEKPEIALGSKIKQILTKWQKRISNYNCQLATDKENQLVEKCQLLIKKISTDTAWVSSLLALTSVGIVSEIAPIWSGVNQNLWLKLPLLKNSINLKNHGERLFPLLAMEEIDLIIFRHHDGDDLSTKKPNKIHGGDRDFGLSPPRKFPVNKQEWLMYPTKVNGSLMAIPPLQNQPSVAGFSSFLSTLDRTNPQGDYHLSKFNLFNKNKLLSEPLDSVTYHLDDKLMAIPNRDYKPYLPQINF